MTDPVDARKTAKIAAFVHAELEALVFDLYTQARVKATREDVLGALVLAGRRAPIELVAALLPAFVAREAEEKAAAAAGE